MIFCSHCRRRIPHEEEYVEDLDKAVCENCVMDYIEACYDAFDIAREFGMTVKVVHDEPEEEPEGQIPGQLDMFGGMVE